MTNDSTPVAAPAASEAPADDLVRRLRLEALRNQSPVCDEAANEIKRLKREPTITRVQFDKAWMIYYTRCFLNSDSKDVVRDMLAAAGLRVSE